MRRSVQRLGRSGWRRAGLLAAIIGALLPAGSQAADPPLTKHVFTAIADAYVSAADDDANYGRRGELRVDGQPVIRTYLKFKLKGLSGSVRTATLQLFVRRSMTEALDVHGVADTGWSERQITFENAPPYDAAVAGSSDVFRGGHWASIDVTRLVSGDGTVSMALTTNGRHLLLFAGREAGPFDPRLVVETAPVTNRNPVTQPDAVSTAEDTPLTFPASALTANDSDPDGDPLSVTGVKGSASTHGTVSLGSDGVTYRPDANFNGSASFAYTVSDGRGGTATGTVTVTVTPVNDAPVAVDDAASTAEDTPLVLAGSALAANDSDVDGDALSVVEVVAGPWTPGGGVLHRSGGPLPPGGGF